MDRNACGVRKLTCDVSRTGGNANPSKRFWAAVAGAMLFGLPAALLAPSVQAQTAATYVSGHIIDVTFANDWVMIRVDAGLPANCAGTAWGWMKVPPENKAMTAFVIGLWMRGDAGQSVVTVYTDGLVGGYCRITQIDPAG